MSSRRVREKLREMRIARDVELDNGRADQEREAMLAKMTKTELINYAEENGIEIDKTAKKAEILGKIKE